MNDEKITLDKKVFKTLASGTRVDILKSLDKRRKTLSELAKYLGMSVSTVKEHLDNLVSVDLIVQMDDGHKWKYYELTKKGRDILHPEDKRIWIMLGISALAMAVTGIDLLRNSFRSIVTSPQAQTFAAGGEARDVVAKAVEESSGDILLGAPESAPAMVSAAPQLPYLHIALLLIFGVFIAASIFYVWRTRKEINV